MLTRHELFCKEYMVDMVATAAAVRAGYGKDSAQANASRMMKNPKIKARIEELIRERDERLSLKPDLVLRELMNHGMLDMAGAFDPETGELLDITEMPENIRRAIASVTVQTDPKTGFVSKQVKFWDKNKALEMIGRHLKMFTDKIEHIGLEGLAQKLAEARARAEKTEA